jgi:hypothetical protein
MNGLNKNDSASNQGMIVPSHVNGEGGSTPLDPFTPFQVR